MNSSTKKYVYHVNLGYIVSVDDIHLDPKNEAVLKLAYSQRMSGNFLVSIAVIYMWFVDGCATIARPLYDLLVGYPTNSAVKKTKSAILGQNHQGINRVIAYASHILKPAKKNYPAHKLFFVCLFDLILYLPSTIFHLNTQCLSVSSQALYHWSSWH